MEDKLMDMLIDIPGLAESVTTPNKTIAFKQMIMEEIVSLRRKLSQWRMEWHRLNPDCATQKYEPRQENLDIPPLISSYLSSKITLKTAQQALELICFHSAMLFLGQLEIVLNGFNPDQDVLRSIKDHERRSAEQKIQPQSNVLLLPHEVEYYWQDGIQALQILAGFRTSMSEGPELYITFAPLAILYCFAQSIGVKQTMISMISGEAWDDDAEVELGVYRLYSLGTAAPETSGNINETGEQDREPQENSGVAVARRLFVNSAWP